MNSPLPESPSPSPMAPSPFHPGEQTVQALHGVRDKAEKLGQRMLTAELVDAQREFFAQLPFVVTSHLDGSGQPWAGLVTGEPGFIQVSADGRVHMERGGAQGKAFESPAALDVSPGSQIGLLGIEFARRRRNRINTTVLSADADQVTMHIDQGYGNCPKYITKRPWDAENFSGDYVMDEWTHIPAIASEIIRHADTFFIASSSGPVTGDSDVQPGAWGADISHRGGEPGFLQQDAEVLWFDDYPGNNMFNTLGNLHQYPHCGLLVIDFISGSILQLTGTAKLHHDNGHYRVAVTVGQIRHWQRSANA
jgi:predicted pyridoxine 5'-phosphate oxidase superfamily flavin-nucleotide-binding protein